MKKRLLTTLVVLTGLFLLSASIVWAQPAPVAKTGQTTSYTTGDDGDYENGVASPSPRFTDNGDGTVTDNLTGLMWAKDASNPGKTTWSNAITYANNLSLGSGGCGTNYTDWRLPNVKELQSLIVFDNYSPALPTGHPFSYVQMSSYWSSTTDANFTDSSWHVNMTVGYVRRLGKHYDFYYVWPVRSETADSPAPVANTGQTTSYVTGDDGYYQKGVASPSPRFTDNGDRTVTDNLTGLMWAKNANFFGYIKNWNMAIFLANNLSLGSGGCGTNYTDWRLPNIKELQSLIGFDNYSPALPTGHPFSYVQLSSYWSSTGDQIITNFAWGVDLYSGNVNTRDKTDNTFYMWPVRSVN
jgi:hypothetical protein